MRTGIMRIVLLTVLLGLSASRVWAAMAAVPLPVDYQTIVSRADLIYGQPAASPVAGHPIGNGRMGTLVWTTPSAVEFQINRTDVFAVNKNTAGSQHGPTDYGGGCARVSVNVGGDPFQTGAGFSQQLSLYDAEDVIQGNDVSARVFVASNDVLVLEVDDRRATPQPMQVDVSMWRNPVVTNGPHTAGYAFQDTSQTSTLVQQFTDTGYYNGSAVSVQVAGAGGVVQTSNNSRSITVPAAAGKRLIQISSAASWDPGTDLASAAAANLAANAGKTYETLKADHTASWNELWSRTFVDLSGNNGIAQQAERQRNLQLYYMASSSRGAVPPKWNGSIFAVDGDARAWGSQYWVWTTESSYFPLYAADAVELTNPFFDMYVSQLPAAKEAARQRWNANGAFYPETNPFDGPVVLPEDAALEVRQVLSGERTKAEFSGYARALCSFDGHLWVLTVTPDQYTYISHIASSGSELAAQAWWRYRYTGDTAFLSTKAYPLLKETVEFYRSLAQKGTDGLYHLEGLNQHEDFWGVKDGIQDLAAIRGTVPLAIRAAETLGLDADLRSQWSEFLDNLVPYPMGSDPQSQALSGGVLAGDVWSAGHLGDVNGIHIGEDIWHNPVFPFEDWTLETRSPPSDAMVQRMTDLLPRMASVLNGNSLNTAIRTPIAEVRAGRGGNLPAILSSYYSAFSPLANGMSLFEGTTAQSIEHLGIISTTVQEALLQSVSPHPGEQEIINVFPAWPLEWDAEFSLLARGGFLVRSSCESGEVAYIEIESRLGETFWLRNPWSVGCFVQQIGGPVWRLAGDVLHFETEAGERYLISDSGGESIPVLNHSFEDAAGGEPGHLVISPLANWIQIAGTGYSQKLGPVDDGTCRGLLRTSEILGDGVETVWTQELAAAFAADTVYSLTVAVGGGEGDPRDGGAYDISLYAGDTELVSGSATGYINTNPLSYKDVTITYDPATSEATPTVGDSLKIVLRSIPDLAGEYWTVYDNVRVTAAPISTGYFYFQGDANLDGTVDAEDAAILAGYWQTGPGASWSQGDFNGDGFVNDLDATLLAANWQTGVPAGSTAIPEPAAMVLLIGGLVCFVLRRRVKNDLSARLAGACCDTN